MIKYQISAFSHLSLSVRDCEHKDTFKGWSAYIDLIGMGMSESVTIPKEEYEFLTKCRDIIHLESDDDFAPEFLEKLKKAEKGIKSGKGVVLKTRDEVEKYLRPR